MKLTPDHPDFETTLVFLNDKLCKTFLAADDEEGWIEIPDIATMAPLDLTEEGATQAGKNIEEEWEEIPIKRIEGKVEFNKIETK